MYSEIKSFMFMPCCSIRFLANEQKAISKIALSFLILIAVKNMKILYTQSSNIFKKLIFFLRFLPRERSIPVTPVPKTTSYREI